MMTKRALFCIPSFTFGGAEKHSFQTAKVLLEEGYEVYFLAFGKKDGFDTFLQSQRIKTLSFDNANFQNSGPIKKILIIFRLLGVLRQIKPIYIFSGTKHENILMGIVWRFSGAKKFFWHQWGIDETKPSKLERFVILSKPIYIANSRACAQNIFMRHRIKNFKSIFIIHNPVSIGEQFQSINENVDEFRILMTANFFPEKDHKTVIKAIQLINLKHPKNNIKLIFAGSAPGISSQLMDCKSFAFDLGLSKEQIQFLGKVEDIVDLIKRCHLGLLSTKNEGMSNAIMEYMATGLPVIATDIDQNKELMGDHNITLLFPVGDSEKCAELIQYFYLNHDQIKKVGMSNYNRIKQHF